MPASAAQEIPPADGYGPIAERLRAFIETELRDKELPALSIALVDGDRVVWAAGFGSQDADGTTPAGPDTIYRVGSISKLFTDLAVMQLVEQGRLDLDEPIQTYLPEFQPHNPFGGKITLRLLMSHRSGLVRESPVGNYFDPDEPSLKATVDSLNDTSLVYPPGTKTKYSNAGIAVVGYVLERVCGRPFEECLQESVFQPLALNRSSFELTPEIDRHLADAQMWTYDGRRFPAPKFGLGTAPAGNLYSTVTDLSQFLIAVFRDGQGANGRILNPETLKLMTTPQSTGEEPRKFAIGFHIAELDGHRKIGHGGAVYGFSTQLGALPDKKLGVAAVSALDGSNGLVGRIEQYAFRLLLAKREGRPLPEITSTGPVPQELARRLVGRYAAGEKHVELSELNGDLFFNNGLYRYEVRATADGLTVDDALGYAPAIGAGTDSLTIGGTTYQRTADPLPPPAPDRWKGLIGEYGWDHNTLYILEHQGQLWALIEWFYYYPLEELSETEFAFPDYGLYHGEKLIFTRDTAGTASRVVAAEVAFDRREVGTKEGETFKITPLKPADELRRIALAAEPPPEADKLPPDLVELVDLDPTIRLDIRYASTNNFMGSVFYRQPKAYMQRPAAEAAVRAHKRLQEHGLGLLIHDAYRPWYVTKMFWDATPDEMKDFVANPANGSRHNRGCAVDLTLYDLASGEPIVMVAGYDEFSQRSFPAYPGGTSRQRWYRELLRHTMEAENFTVYDKEWWHFDFEAWRRYPILNQTFEQLEGTE